LIGVEAVATGAAAAQKRPRLLVARKDRLGLAFPVDEVMGLQRYHQDSVGAAPATVVHAVPQFTRGMLTVEGRKIGLLDDDLIVHALTKELA
jgi:chemotaxis-related protein WspD